MRKPGLDGDAWPSRIQELALRAALGDHDAAAAAWVELAPLVEADAGRDHEMQRLLPLVGHNLRRVGVVDARADALTAMTRRNWYRSRTIIDGAGPALAALAEAEVPTIVLKGTALAVAYYEHPGLRYLSDVDVLVPHTAAARSLDVLGAAGWVRTGRTSRERRGATHDRETCNGPPLRRRGQTRTGRGVKPWPTIAPASTPSQPSAAVA